jgi:hypothetical protein
MNSDSHSSAQEKALKDLRSWVYISLALAMWLLFMAAVDFAEYNNSNSLSPMSALWNLSLAIFLLISIFLLWKRNLFVLVSFAIFTILLLLTPLFVSANGFQPLDILRAAYPLALFWSMYGYWKQGLFRSEN